MMMILENRVFDLKKDRKRDLASYRQIEYKRTKRTHLQKLLNLDNIKKEGFVMKMIIENRAFEMKSEKRRALNILESIELKRIRRK